MSTATTEDLKIEPKLHHSWKKALEEEFGKAYFAELKKFLEKENAAGQTVYPLEVNIFTAFNLTPFDEVKVVLLGQDPYHGPKQAHGLSFSVLDGITPPPSLKNIFKELQADLGVEIPKSGDLTKWAKEGVFLLNAILTVRAQKPASHQKKGWEDFTDAVIKTLSDKREGLVYILWGKFAQSKEVLIDTKKHYVLKAAHPSPFSADKGFFGSKPFSKTNKILEKLGKEPIDWDLTK
ncbi:MAG: uracil-DNA glycosylase [Bacteroidia bacterium]